MCTQKTSSERNPRDVRKYARAASVNDESAPNHSMSSARVRRKSTRMEITLDEETHGSELLKRQSIGGQPRCVGGATASLSSTSPSSTRSITIVLIDKRCAV